MSATIESYPHEPDDRESVERTAAAWALRERAGLGAAERAELAAWLAASPRHAAVFAEMAETSAMLDQLRERPSPAFAARARWLVPAAAAIVVIGAVMWQRDAPEPSTAPAPRVATQIGAVRTEILPDGTQAQLNTDTALEIHFSDDERRVRLTRGEAHFTITPDSTRPFVVDAAGVAVRAVGTAFCVRLRPDEIDVVVTHGRIAVTSSRFRVTSTTPAELIAGQRMRLPAPGAASSASPPKIQTIDLAEIGRLLAWREGRLDFVDASLAEVVAEFNRHHRHQLEIADPALAAQRFGGAFSAQSTESFLELLQLNFGVVTERQPGRTILRRASTR